MIIEDAETKEFMVFLSFGTDEQHRGNSCTTHDTYSESSMLVNPKYRKHKIGSELMDILFALSKK